jgi:tetraprenyl-beta-curcumene synthase
MEDRDNAHRGPARRAVRGLGERVAQAAVFTRAAVRYWLVVFPRACVELRRWRRRAALIPSPALRQAALAALEERGNIEGAAAFAAFVPRRHRGGIVRALVAFHVAYNHVDALAEQPSDDPVGNACDLHQALLVALDPDMAHRDARRLHPRYEDGGYLAEVVDACRTALGGLPAYAAVAAQARGAAARIVAFQSLSLGGREGLERWALMLAPADSRLEPWEAAAAAGSSLGVCALIAAAAASSPRAEELAAIERAYFPWIGALHSLLDSAVDVAEDAATGQLSLVGCYRSPRDAALRMRWLTVSALDLARGLPDGRRHAALVTAMACHYLSGIERSAAGELDADLAHGVREALGGLARPALLLLTARRLAGRCGRGRDRAPAVRRDSGAIHLGDRERGVDARAA